MHYGSGSAADRYIAANVIANASLYQTQLRSTTDIINVLNYNFYIDANGLFASGGSVPNEHDGLSAFQAALGFSTNSKANVNANFINEHSYDFRLSAESELIKQIPMDFINAQPFISDLENDLGIDSLYDMDGKPRQQANDYDAGAFSYTP